MASAFIQSCTETGDRALLIKGSKNQVIFEDMSLKTNVSPNFYDNHFYSVQKLGNNKERKSLMNVIERSGIHLSVLNPKAVKKFYFNNSDIIMYAVFY